MVTLHGFKFSVYTRIARLALVEKGVAFSYTETNPFAADGPAVADGLHPFKRVPVLDHDGFVVYETAAITQYIDDAFEGPSLMPVGVRDKARVRQIIGVIDSYGYWPLVRQVFAHGVFRPLVGEPSDPAVFSEGLNASGKVLAALEALTEGGPGRPAHRRDAPRPHLIAA